jgi:hypothetical protein
LPRRRRPVPTDPNILATLTNEAIVGTLDDAVDRQRARATVLRARPQRNGAFALGAAALLLLISPLAALPLTLINRF